MLGLLIGKSSITIYPFHCLIRSVMPIVSTKNVVKSLLKHSSKNDLMLFPESQFQLYTPVAFFIFRRPATTRRVFEAIRRAQPPILLVIADGPRDAQEAALCA